MRMRLVGETLEVIETDNIQYQVIRSWQKMVWDRKTKMLRGTADLELLDKLAGMVRLPPNIEARRTRLRAIQDAVDRERVNPSPVAFFRPPVKASLYQHQIRGFDMCLLIFGWATPTMPAGSNQGGKTGG